MISHLSLVGGAEPSRFIYGAGQGLGDTVCLLQFSCWLVDDDSLFRGSSSCLYQGRADYLVTSLRATGSCQIIPRRIDWLVKRRAIWRRHIGVFCRGELGALVLDRVGGTAGRMMSLTVLALAESTLL